MALTSGVLGPMVFLAVRNNVIENLGAEQAGYWEAISRISTYYLMFVTTLLSVYFLPKLVLAKKAEKIKAIFLNYYKNVLSVFLLVLVILYFLRSFIVKILFTSDFEPVSNLFFWQLIGDFLKAASLIFGYQLLAHKMTKVFIITEIISLTTFYFSSTYLVRLFGIEGVVMAHAFTYFIYLMVLVFYFRDKFRLVFKS